MEYAHMEYDRAALKRSVKDELRNTQPRAVMVTLVYLLLSFILGLIVEIGQSPLTGLVTGFTTDLQWLMDEFLTGPGMFNERGLVAALDNLDLFDQLEDILVFSSVFGLISSIINWTLTYGYEGYCLDMVRRRNPGYPRLLCAFPKWGWVLLAGFLVSLFTALWTVLICVLAAAATVVVLLSLEGSWGVTLTIVIWVAAAVWLVSVLLRYSMTNYILLDEKVDALEAISRSKAMMRGRKWHLFVLELSFVGWLLLAVLIGGVVGSVATLAVGVPYSSTGTIGTVIVTAVTQVAMMPFLMWLQPYMVGSTARFYDWMKHTDIENGVWEGRYPKRRKPGRSQEEPQAPKGEAPVLPEAPHIPAYEEPAPQPEQPRAGEQPVQPEKPDAPAGDVPDRPNYE